MQDSVGVSLGIFVKEPRPGRVKTRLARSIGEARAAALYRAFVQDTLTLASNAGARHRRIFHDGAPPGDWAGGAATGFTPRPQVAGDLGRRLDEAFRDGPCPLLILGSDSPDLPRAHLLSALRALDDGAQLVLGATHDGGVWCIGLDRRCPALLADIPWSSTDTGDALRNRADALGLNRVEVAPWYDCDLEADLQALVARLHGEPAAATMTRRLLIPTDPDPE
jgi:rSAM/selenodomain-associated transferase 1